MYKRQVFHSSSASATQDAVEVWGNSVPYLQSVDSPEGENVPNYQSQATISSQEFQDLFLEARPEADLSGDPSTWVGDTQYNDGGSVHTITIGGVTVTGAQALSLIHIYHSLPGWVDGKWVFRNGAKAPDGAAPVSYPHLPAPWPRR